MSRNVINDEESVSKSPGDTSRENTSSPIFKVITSKFRGRILIIRICFESSNIKICLKISKWQYLSNKNLGLGAFKKSTKDSNEIEACLDPSSYYSDSTSNSKLHDTPFSGNTVTTQVDDIKSR